MDNDDGGSNDVDPSNDSTEEVEAVVVDSSSPFSNAWRSTCLQEPPEGSIQRDQRLAFYYNVYLLAANNGTTSTEDDTDVLRSLEEDLHWAMARHFLTCQFDDDDSVVDFVSIDSAPIDVELLEVTCDTTNDPPLSPAMKNATKCVVVQGQVQLEASFPSTNSNNNRRYQRRLQEEPVTEATAEVIDVTGDFFRSTMENGDYDTDQIPQVTFQGFVNVDQAANSGTSNGGSGFSEANRDVETVFAPSNENSNAIWGASALGLALLCCILFTMFALSHRRKLREAYLKQVDQLSTSEEQDWDVHGAFGDRSMMEEDSVYTDFGFRQQGRAVALDDKVEWVVDRELTAELDHIDRIMESRDVHACSSATCRECAQRRARPTFLKSPVYLDEDHRTEIPERMTYSSPDTVDF